MRGGRLQDVPNIVIWLGNFWYFGKLVAEERWSLTRGGRLQEVPNIVIWLGNFWYFGKLVAEERWSLTRGGRNQRFDCLLRPSRRRVGNLLISVNVHSEPVSSFSLEPATYLTRLLCLWSPITRWWKQIIQLFFEKKKSLTEHGECYQRK